MLQERIASELKSALRGRDELRLSVFRMLSSAIHNREIERRARSGGGETPLTEEEVMQVIRAESKKRGEAAQAYQRGERTEAAARERTEAVILDSLLPPELSDGELGRMVAEGKAALGAATEKDFGKLMGWVMARVEGQASGERVSAVVRRELDPATGSPA